MKEIIVWSILLHCVARLSHAAVYLLPPQPKFPEFAHKQGCYAPNLNLVLPFNKPYSPADGTCLQYTCGTDGVTQVFSCSRVSAGEECKVVPGDKSLAYPDCCSTIKCS